MNILQIDTAGRRRLKQFLDLPFRIYRDMPQWAPPLDPDARLMLDRRRHPFYRHSDAAFFLALADDGNPIGRLAHADLVQVGTDHIVHYAFAEAVRSE